MLGIQTEKQEARPCPFPVDDVVPASVPLPTESLGNHVAKRFRRKLIFLPEAERPVANAYLRNVLAEKRRPLRAEYSVCRCHPLVDAVATAFSQHRPLTLSPDAIWLAIEQGFAHHLAENAESLRNRMVRHHGSRELIARVSDTSPQSFELAIADFSSQIRDASDPVLHETLVCDFSTTTPAIRTASEIVLMDCYSSYFTYVMLCICGIPKITVRGSLSDWQRIRARIEVLATFDLEWWAARLRPILDEFVRTVQGCPSLTFWQAIYKPKQSYGTETVTGWIADLFPYLSDPPDRRRSHIFEFDRKDWAVPVEMGVKTRGGFAGEPSAGRGVATRSFPSGLASVPVKFFHKNPAALEMNLDLVAGFLGIEQDPADLALSPVISWSVTERAPEKPVTVW